MMRIESKDEESYLEIEDALDRLNAEIAKHTDKGIYTSWNSPSQGKWLVSIRYMMENRFADFILEKEFSKAIRKIDPKAKVSRTKESAKAE